MIFKQKYPEARFKKLSLPLDFAAQMYLAEATHPGDCLIRYKFKDRNHPNGFEFYYAYPDYSSKSVNFVFYDKDWDIVPDGSVLPDIDPKTISEMTIDVYQITENTKILSYASTPVLGWRSLGSML